MQPQRIIYRFGPVTWAIIDCMIAALAVGIAYYLSPYTGIAVHPGKAEHIPLVPAMICLSLCASALAQIVGLHDPLSPKTFWFTLGRSLVVSLVAVILLSFYAATVRYERVGRYILIGIQVLLPAGMVIFRWVFWRRLQTTMRLMVVSVSKEPMLQDLIRDNHLLAEVVYVQSDCGSLPAKCLAHQIDEVVYCDSQTPSPTAMEQLIQCQRQGVRISSFGSFCEKHLYRIPSTYINGMWFLMANIDHPHSLYRMVKRVLDLLVSGISMLLLAPLFLLVCLGIMLEDGGPILYNQVRVGRNGRNFRLWKIRTMRVDAEMSGPQWAALGDKRVTRMGRLLRKTRLDEVPQFWNIIQGDMSFIGPRPERPEFVINLEQQVPYYGQRHLLDPGLTGWAQINYPYGASVSDASQKLQYDLFYIKNISLALDVQIILRTLGALMKGAR